MGLLTFPAQLPLLPLRGVVRLAQVIGDQAGQEQRDPVRIRRALEDAQRRHAAGEITDEELSQLQYAIVGGLVSGASTDSATAGQDRS